MAPLSPRNAGSTLSDVPFFFMFSLFFLSKVSFQSKIDLNLSQILKISQFSLSNEMTSKEQGRQNKM